jgi:hypothetical protein
VLTLEEETQLVALLRKVRDHVHPDAALVSDDRGERVATGT